MSSENIEYKIRDIGCVGDRVGTRFMEKTKNIILLTITNEAAI